MVAYYAKKVSASHIVEGPTINFTLVQNGKNYDVDMSDTTLVSAVLTSDEVKLGQNSDPAVDNLIALTEAFLDENEIDFDPIAEKYPGGNGPRAGTLDHPWMIAELARSLPTTSELRIAYQQLRLSIQSNQWAPAITAAETVIDFVHSNPSHALVEQTIAWGLGSPDGQIHNYWREKWNSRTGTTTEGPEARCAEAIFAILRRLAKLAKGLGDGSLNAEQKDEWLRATATFFRYL